MPSKSIFRQPGAKHFQLVHRSQRDPLINDPDASTHVLKLIDRENAKKEKSRADLESILTLDEITDQGSIGEASLYGVYFDDTEYDYMQHLRTVGAQQDSIESILIEAPVTSKGNAKAEPTSLDALELPDGVLASPSEVPRNFETQQAIPDSIAGFQPDMDPHLRQVLEALDDDAFVDENLDDEFFSKLVCDGERGSDEGIDFEFTTRGITEIEDGINCIEEESWEKRFSDFKQRHQKSLENDSDYSDGDTVRELPTVSVLGGKKRRKGSSEASGYSMSSSSMYRNEALQTLDERFDQMLLKEYQDKSDDHDDMSKDGEQSDEAPELITSRSDFGSMVNDFLNNYEILGRKMRLKLEGGTGPEKLDILRRSMGQDEQGQVADVEIEDEEDIFLSDQEDEKAKWDCETILTTHTNFGNHPRLIRGRDSKPVPRFQLDHKTGLPSVLSAARPKQKTDRVRGMPVHTFAEPTDSAKTVFPTTARPRNESKEDKKLRKIAVKQGKQVRRTERKTMKEQFGLELQEQKRILRSREQNLKRL